MKVLRNHRISSDAMARALLNNAPALALSVWVAAPTEGDGQFEISICIDNGKQHHEQVSFDG